MRPSYLGVLVVLMLILVTVTFPAEGAGELSEGFDLDGPAFGRLLLEAFPQTDFQLGLLVGYTRPGVILDTVGLNAAPVGAWAMLVDGEGHITFQVYAPELQSPWRADSGWHVMRSTQAVAPGRPGIITLTVRGLDIELSVELGAPQKLRLGRPLSGESVWVGDFPGDNHWGEEFNIHPAMTGRLMVSLKRLAPTPSPTEAPPTPPPTPPTSPVTISATEPGDDLAVVAAGVEAALKAGDLEAVLALTHPSRREALGVALAASVDDMPKLGEWLAGRKLASQTEAQAEYEVTVEEALLCVQFAESEGKWWLLSL